MHLLNRDQANDRLAWAGNNQPSAAPKILAGTYLDAPAMDHLDALEAQSIYIFREAFARLKKLALLWSLAKIPT